MTKLEDISELTLQEILDRITSLEKANDVLGEKNEELMRVNSVMGNRNVNLVYKKEELLSRIDRLEDAIIVLNKQNTKLCYEREELKKEKERIHNQYGVLEEAYSELNLRSISLYDEKVDLLNQINEIKEELRFANFKYSRLIEKYKEAKEECGVTEVSILQRQLNDLDYMRMIANFYSPQVGDCPECPKEKEE